MTFKKKGVFMRFILGMMLSLGLVQASFAATTNPAPRKAVLFTDQILAQAKLNVMSGKCTWNWECFSNEQCLNEECVARDAFNRCDNDFDCWPGECVDHACKDR
jgi:hypothetical protein